MLRNLIQTPVAELSFWGSQGYAIGLRSDRDSNPDSEQS